MKRICAFLCVLCLMLTLCACTANAPSETKNTNTPTANSETEEPTVKTTNASETTAPTLSTEASSWEVITITDEFGDPTDEKALRCTFEGSFSNTATSSSDLRVVVFLVNPNEWVHLPSDCGFAFRLFEYGDHIATYSRSDELILKVKIDGEIYSQPLIGIPPNGDLYFFNDFGFDFEGRTLCMELMDRMWNGNDVPCIIEIGSSKYKFTLTGDGYINASNELDEISE